MMLIQQRLRQVADFLREPAPSNAVRTTPIFDRFCIAFLGTDWLIFGSMHFSWQEQTRSMLPFWVPWPDAVVVSTGMAEVAAGILLFYPATRRSAASVSLVLLILLLPAVAHILQDDAALPFADMDGLMGRLWRSFLIPHNALMGICAIHLLRKPFPDPWGLPMVKAARTQGIGDRGRAILLIFAVLLLCNAAGYLALLLGVKANSSTAAMWMMMCLALGGLVGFLFAVPRAARENPGAGALQANRNIEEISDWLTKIIVGLGLVNLKQIGQFLSSHAESLAKTLQVEVKYTLASLCIFSWPASLRVISLREFSSRNFFEAVKL